MVRLVVGVRALQLPRFMVRAVSQAKCLADALAATIPGELMDHWASGMMSRETHGRSYGIEHVASSAKMPASAAPFCACPGGGANLRREVRQRIIIADAAETTIAPGPAQLPVDSRP